MPDVPPSPDRQRYASGSGPVNRRNVAPRVTAPAPHPSLQKKIARNTAQHTMGRPLAQQLAKPAQRTQIAKPTIPVAVGLTLSAAGVLLAGFQASVIGAAASVLVGGVVAAYAFMRTKPVAPVGHTFDQESLSALDKALADIVATVPAATLAQLAELKATVVRVAPLLATAGVSENFTQEDKFYLAELVRRYLPDSLSAYLRVPANRRDVAGADGGPSALELLSDQLTLLQTEVARRELLLVQGTHAALQQQQRFLQAKHRSE